MMVKIKSLAVVLFGLTVVTGFSSQAEMTYKGTVERVWEDGFRLNTGDHVLTIDAWDVYGDNTPQSITVGDQVTITGEFEGRQFDAFSIVKQRQSQSSDSPSQAEMTYKGTVERVWEDGFRLNTGDRVLTIDAWDVYGDNTPQSITVGDQVTITGEFDGKQFDAFSIVK
jgi:putative NADPH-quinone reductase